MKGFKELQIEDIRNIDNGIQHATLLNIVGASGNNSNGSLCNTIHIDTIRNPNTPWGPLGGGSGVYWNYQTGEYAVSRYGWAYQQGNMFEDDLIIIFTPRR